MERRIRIRIHKKNYMNPRIIQTYTKWTLLLLLVFWDSIGMVLFWVRTWAFFFFYFTERFDSKCILENNLPLPVSAVQHFSVLYCINCRSRGAAKKRARSATPQPTKIHIGRLTRNVLKGNKLISRLHRFFRFIRCVIC